MAAGTGEDAPRSGGELEAAARSAARALTARGSTLAVAESCTGGLIMKVLTDRPGSSRYLLGGVVAYADPVKAGVLGVSEGLLREHGAVSRPVVRDMARGGARVFGADVGLAVTGVAGPGGATPGKPVGTVWLGVAFPGGARERLVRLRGDREEIRREAARLALDLLLEALDPGSSSAAPEPNPRDPSG